MGENTDTESTKIRHFDFVLGSFAHFVEDPCLAVQGISLSAETVLGTKANQFAYPSSIKVEAKFHKLKETFRVLREMRILTKISSRF